MFFFNKKPSLKQIRWLPVMFFCAVMMFGLRLHEKQHAFFQENSWNFFSEFSFLSINPLKAATEPPFATKEASTESPKSSFPASTVESSIPKPQQTSVPLPASSPASPQVQAAEPEKDLNASKDVLDVLNLTTEEVKILQSLATRRGDIERREKTVNEKEKLVRVIERRIQDKVMELERIQETLKELVAVREKQESEELKGLVKIYELMKPDRAAEILSGLAADILIDLLNGMRDSKLAPILANMDPSIAQQITIALAERRKLTQELQQIAQQQQPPQQQ